MKILNRVILFLPIVILVICSCEDGEEKILSIPQARFDASSLFVDEEDTVFFTDLSHDDQVGIVGWDWNFGDESVSEEQSPWHVYATAGEYIVQLHVTNALGNRNLNNYSKRITVSEKSMTNVEPEILWKFTVPYFSDHNVAPAVGPNGKVFVATDGKSSDPTRGNYNIFAIENGNASYGALTDQVVRSSVSVADDGTAYAGDYNGILTAINTDGTTKWSKQITNEGYVKYSSPAIGTDGTIYIGLEDADCLTAISPQSGEVNWTFKVGHDVRCTPVLDSNGKIYFGSSDGKFYAVNPDGTEAWSQIYGSYSVITPAVYGNTVYFAGRGADDGKGHLIAYNTSDGSVKWEKTRSEDLTNGGPVVADDGTVYLGGLDSLMVAYSADGAEKWSFKASNTILSVPAIDNNGNIYFGDMSGIFYVLGSDGELKYKQINLGAPISSAIAIDDAGVVYVLARNEADKLGELYALKTNATSQLMGGWPMKSANAQHTGRTN